MCTVNVRFQMSNVQRKTTDSDMDSLIEQDGHQVGLDLVWRVLNAWIQNLLSGGRIFGGYPASGGVLRMDFP